MGVAPDSCHLKHLCIPHNTHTAVCLNFILIRIVTSGDNHTSLSERAALSGKHFEPSDYHTRIKAATISLQKQFLIITAHFKDCSDSVVLLSQPGRVMNYFHVQYVQRCQIHKSGPQLVLLKRSAINQSLLVKYIHTSPMHLRK